MNFSLKKRDDGDGNDGISSKSYCSLHKSSLLSDLSSFPLSYPGILNMITLYLSIQDIIALSSISKLLRNHILIDHMLWNQLLYRYFPKQAPDLPSSVTGAYDNFLSLTSKRIWNWNLLFSSPIFWAQVGFTLDQEFEDHKIFGVSFSDSSDNGELKKKDIDFEDWSDGHNLIFHLPQNYKLYYQISDHTMGTWTLETEDDTELLCRLDGHPLLPGFTFDEANLIITYIRDRSSPLLIDSSHLWPLFFPFIELSPSSLPKPQVLIQNLRQSSWKKLHIHYKKWKRLENYIKSRCKNSGRSQLHTPSRDQPSLLSNVCALLTNELERNLITV